MKILITGSTGLLGRALARHLSGSADVTGLSRRATQGAGEARHVACDLRDAASAAAAVQAAAPDMVFHTQAMSDVDRCELEPAVAWEHNVGALERLVAALDPERTWLVCLSSDYVFDGTKGAPYVETDAPNPLSAYGRAKLAAERVALGYPQSAVVRTSTLFGPGRRNFCDHIVHLVRAGQPIEAFSDQVTSPTYTVDLAGALAELGERLGSWTDPAPPPRVFHAANAGGASRVAFARRVIELLGGDAALLRPIPMAGQARPAARPAYSALASERLPQVIGRSLRPWESALQAYLRP